MFRTLFLTLTILFALIIVLRLQRDQWRLSGVLRISIAAALVVELIGWAMVGMKVKNSLPYNLFMAVEFVLLLRLVGLFAPDWRKVLLMLAIAGLGALGVNALYHHPTTFLLVEAVILLSLMLSVVLLFALWRLANTSELPLGSTSEFWLFMGLLIYFGGMMPVMGLVRFVFEQDQALAARLYLIIPYLCIVRYALTAVACLVQHRRRLRTVHG